MGLARMSAGGHFASDVLWAGYVVFSVCWLLYYFVFKAFGELALQAEEELDEAAADGKLLSS